MSKIKNPTLINNIHIQVAAQLQQVQDGAFNNINRTRLSVFRKKYI